MERRLFEIFVLVRTMTNDAESLRQGVQRGAVFGGIRSPVDVQFDPVAVLRTTQSFEQDVLAFVFRDLAECHDPERRRRSRNWGALHALVAHERLRVDPRRVVSEDGPQSVRLAVRQCVDPRSKLEFVRKIPPSHFEKGGDLTVANSDDQVVGDARGARCLVGRRVAPTVVGEHAVKRWARGDEVVHRQQDRDSSLRALSHEIVGQPQPVMDMHDVGSHFLDQLGDEPGDSGVIHAFPALVAVVVAVDLHESDAVHVSRGTAQALAPLEGSCQHGDVVSTTGEPLREPSHVPLRPTPELRWIAVYGEQDLHGVRVLMVPVGYLDDIISIPRPPECYLERQRCSIGPRE